MNTYIIQPDPLAEFKKNTKSAPATWGGRVPTKWADNIEPGLGNQYQLPTVTLTRADLISLWQDRSYSTEKAFLSTMAWGQMKADNARKIWMNHEQLIRICEKVRNGEYSRKDAFKLFHDKRKEGKLPGLGPAYYTKILFFANQSLAAYILDQWTARSIHILTMQREWPRVQIDYSSRIKAERINRPQKLRVTVTDHVSPEDYEHYCIMVETLAQTLGISPSDTEERMFGNGGRNPSDWRNYIMDNWHKLQP